MGALSGLGGSRASHRGRLGIFSGPGLNGLEALPRCGGVGQNIFCADQPRSVGDNRGLSTSRLLRGGRSRSPARKVANETASDVRKDLRGKRKGTVTA